MRQKAEERRERQEKADQFSQTMQTVQLSVMNNFMANIKGSLNLTIMISRFD